MKLIKTSVTQNTGTFPKALWKYKTHILKINHYILVWKLSIYSFILYCLSRES